MTTRLPETETEKKFFAAIKNNQLQAAVNTILRSPDGASVPIAELADEHGMTALHWATSNRNMAGIRWLVDKDADMEIKDDKGRTPLKVALDNKDTKAMTLLLDRGAFAAAALPGHDEELKGFKKTRDLVDFMIKTAAADAAKPPPAVAPPVNDPVVPIEPPKIEVVTPAFVRRLGPVM